MKSVSCKDVGADCNFVAKAETEPELMKILEKHAREKHDMKEIPADMRKKIKSHIREVAVR